MEYTSGTMLPFNFISIRMNCPARNSSRALLSTWKVKSRASNARGTDLVSVAARRGSECVFVAGAAVLMVTNI